MQNHFRSAPFSRGLSMLAFTKVGQKFLCRMQCVFVLDASHPERGEVPFADHNWSKSEPHCTVQWVHWQLVWWRIHCALLKWRRRLNLHRRLLLQVIVTLLQVYRVLSEPVVGCVMSWTRTILFHDVKENTPKETLKIMGFFFVFSSGLQLAQLSISLCGNKTWCHYSVKCGSLFWR